MVCNEGNNKLISEIDSNQFQKQSSHYDDEDRQGKLQ